MNEQAFKDLYEEFKRTGYLGTEADFKILISTNPEAFNDGFSQFTTTGYNGDADAFANLIGVNNPLKKKEESDFISQDQDGGLVTENISSATQPQTEQDFFEGTFGDILRGFDAVTQTGLGDFVDDMARSAATGYYQGQVAEDASDILLRGVNATDEDIYSFIEANKEAQKLGPSDEMMEYQKTYEENGKGFMGVVMGLYKSGFQVIPEVILSSVISMITNKDSLSTGAAVVGTGALYGAGTGALAGGIGAVPGAIAGGAATLPYAFAAAGSVLEMGATFSELLQEEIEGELTPKKIRDAISNEEIYTSIRNKALARGITIGVIDAFTGRIGGKVAGKILSKAATKGTKIKSVLAASGIESVGGSVGEATARGVIGQEMDISEIALEGIAEAPGGVKDVISARFSKPKYKVNGKKVDAATIDNLLETMNLEQLQATKIKIDNDYEGRGKKLSDRVLQLNIERLILEANPDINPETLSEITRLQLELSSLEGNKTEVAKEKSSILKSKIKDLQENQLETEVATEADAFNELEQDEQIKYIEQAGKELIQESEARGDEEFEITEQQNLERAVELFNKDQQTITVEEVPTIYGPEVVTHQTRSRAAIENWVNGGQIVGRVENLDDFVEGTSSNKTKFQVNRDNRQTPNFQQGGIYGNTVKKNEGGYVIVSKPGTVDVKNFQPNLNFVNKESSKDSRGVLLPKPNTPARDISNYDIYKVVDGKMIKQNPNKFKTNKDAIQKSETKRFQDSDVVLKEETFTVTNEDGGRVVTTVRTNLDGSLRKAEVENFDADGNSLGKGVDISLADNNIVVKNGLTAEQLLTDRLIEGEVIEKTERSGNEINNPKKTAGLTTDQKQKLGIETETEVEVTPKAEGSNQMTPKEIKDERFESIKARNEAERKGDNAEVERQSKRTDYLDSLLDQKTKNRLAIQSNLYSKDAVNKKIEELKKDPFQFLDVTEEIKLLEEVLEEYNKIEALETKKQSTKDTAALEDLDNQIEEAKQKIESYKKFDKISVDPAPKAQVKAEEKIEVETKVEPKTEQEIKARIKELEQVPSGMNAAMQAAKEGKPTKTPEILAMQQADISAKEEIERLKEKLKQPKTDPEISRLEGEVETEQGDIENLQEEIINEKYNFREDVARIKEEKAKIRKDKKLSKDQKIEAIEEKISEQQDLKQEMDSMIESYRDDIKQKQSEIRKANKSLEKITQKPRKQVTKVEQQVDNAKKALNKLDKDIKIVIHNDDSSYRKATGEDNREQSTRGEYNPSTKTIHINATKVQANTVAHEVFHALLLRSGITNKQAKAITDRMLKAVKKTASPELLQKLKEHSENYESALQSEESIAELFGILASEYKSLDKPTQNLVQRWVNKLAKILGVKKFTDAEVIDLLNVVSAKVEAGQEITEQDVAILDKNKSKISNANKRFQADFYDSFSGMTYMYDKNTNEFKQLKKDGYITTDKSITNFNGKYVFFHQPDAAFSGIIAKNGEILVEGKGGMYYPIKFHKDGFFWASTDGAAQKMAEDLNKVLEQNGGTIFMALTSAPYDKLLSSTTMSNAVLDFFTSKMLDNNFKLSEAQLKRSLLKAAKDIKIKKTKNKKTGKINKKKVGLGLNINKNSSVKEIIKIIQESLGPKVKSFGDRKNFATELIKLMSNEINKNDLSVNQFGKLFSEGIQNKYFKGVTKTGKLKISTANMTQALSEMFTEPILKDNIDREKGGQIYAILEVNGKLKPVPSDKHESYPKALKSEGGVKINILTDRVNWSDVTEDFQTNEIVSKDRRNRIYPTSGVSVRGLKINTSNISKSDAPQSRKQQEAKEVYKSNPKLSSIGTLQQYNEYLKTIFPNSEVKDFLYHGGNENIQEFSKEKLGETTKADSAKLGFFFSNNKDVSLTYIERYRNEAIGELKVKVDEFNQTYNKLQESVKNDYEDSAVLYKKSQRLLTKVLDYIKKLLNDKFITSSELYKKQLEKAQAAAKKFENFQQTGKTPSLEISMISEKEFNKNYAVKSRPIKNKKLYTVLLDVKNPLVVNYREDKTDGGRFYVDSVSEAIKNNNDAAILEDVIDLNADPLTNNKDKFIGNDYVVFENNQIYILGSNKDVKGFEDFSTKQGMLKSPSRQGREQSRKQQDTPQSRKQIDMKRLNKMADTFYMKKDGYIPYKTTPLGELQRAARRFGLRVETRYITEGRQRGTPTGYYLSFGKNPEGFPIMFNPRTKQEKVIKNAPQSRKQKPSKKPAQKRTSSIKKAITEIKNVLNITPDEQRKIFKALNDQKKRAKDIKKDIVASLRELTKEGKITPSKMVSVINKVPDDFNNPITVERFVEYMTKVFNNADYGNKMTIANAKKGKAKKNASTKIGIAEGLVEQLQRLFSVKPSLIPDSVLDQYMSLIDMFGKREAVLSLPSIEEVTQMTEDVLQQLDEEQSMAIELADRFDAAEKVMGENGVDYAATIKEMLDNEVITDREYEVMKKYKSEINPPVPETPKTEAEIEAERQDTIENIKETKEIDPSVLPSRLERDDAKELKKLLKTDAVEGLSLDDLKNLFKVIDNINSGYLPHYAKIMISKMTAINDAKVGANAIKRSKLLPLSKIYANLKSKITKKAGTSELVRRNPTFYIDQVFGDFKTQDIFNSIFKRSAEASAKYTKAIKEVQAKIEKAEQAVSKSFGREPNEVIVSKYKQMSYLIQQEFLSNPESNQVNSVEDFLKATIKRIKTETTSYTETDAKMLQKILDKYTANGTKTFDNVALYESFNVAERNSIRTLEEINKSLTEVAVYTANIIRGNKITPLKNYTHLSVIPDVAKGDIVETETSMISDMFNKYLKPSTKAKSLIERTGKASPLNFDVYASVQRGSKYTLMDFHLTDPIRTARRTLNEIEKSLSDKDGNMSSDSRRKFNAIRDASVESIENLLSNALTQSTTGDKVIDYIQKQGYRAILAGVPRAAYELTSNVLAGMFMDPKGFVTGIKLRKVIGTPSAKDIMDNLNSTQTNRVFSTGLSGKFVDTGILNQAAGVTASKAKGKVKNTILQLWNNSGQRWIKGVEFTADTLISSPDKLVMQPMWFGSFENRFKQITGTSPDFDKIAANDEAYMDKYSSALKEAKTLADNRSVAMGATDNSFMGILKGTVKPNQGVSLRVFNAFNGFMTRFLIFEYMTARTGIMAAMGSGQVSKKQGVALLAGVSTRMVAYTFLGSLVAESIKSLTDDDDEDFDFTQVQYEDDDAEGMKSIDKMLGQAMTSAFTSLLFGRDFGNATKGIINYGLEELNENYGQFLRDGEYDKYRDAIQYTLIPEGRSGKSPQFMDVAKNLFAAYTPMLKTFEFGVNKIFETDKVKPDAIERQQDERFVRLPLEALGVAGFIPFYKDIRKIVLANMYKGLRKAKKESANKKKRKDEMLQGYSSETDMKRYDFPLWERTFGPDSPGYDKRQAEKELRRKERKLKQLEKDQMYDYTPPSSTRKQKSSSPFGTASGGGKSSPFGG